MQEPQRVSAADFIRSFANWRLQAARMPVVVTHHGKDAHVLISLDDYHRLDGGAARDIAARTDALQASHAALVEAIRDAVILIDPACHVVAINPAGCDLLERSAAALTGQALAAALPGIETGLLAAARARGLKTLDGLEMLIGQAALAFDIFFDAQAPRELDADLRARLIAAQP